MAVSALLERAGFQTPEITTVDFAPFNPAEDRADRVLFITQKAAS
jgi:hypothetical protein